MVHTATQDDQTVPPMGGGGGGGVGKGIRKDVEEGNTGEGGGKKSWRRMKQRGWEVMVEGVEVFKRVKQQTQLTSPVCVRATDDA